MAKFVLKTGNLSAAIATTAKPFKAVEETKEWTATDTAANRLCLIRYKLSKKQKDDDAKAKGTLEVPASFAIEVPLVSLQAIQETENGNKMLHALFVKHQDSMFKASADKATSVDPTDIAALVKDYFDTSRNKNQPSLEDVSEWARELWSVAYMMRVEQRNAEFAAEGKQGQSEAQTKLIITKYSEMMRMIAKTNCALGRHQVKDILTNIERLIEVGLVESDDEVATFLIERAKEHIAEIDKQIAEHVTGEV